MPRKNLRVEGEPLRPVIRFNEAAARCRGKTMVVRRGRTCVSSASMRPRPDAAEKQDGQSGCGGLLVAASMRPRPDAAEKLTSVARTPRKSSGFNEAAARCRGKTLTKWLESLRRVRASMRPRPDAAEKRPAACPRRGRRGGFNEAAARCRGKTPRGGAGGACGHRASMRPRPDAAEKRRPRRRRARREVGASMRPRPDAAEKRRRP